LDAQKLQQGTKHIYGKTNMTYFCEIRSHNLVKMYRLRIKEDSNIHRNCHENTKNQLKSIPS